MKATVKDIVPGKVLYYVFFLPGREGGEAELQKKVIVTSHINANNNIKKPCFSAIDDYRPYDFDWEHLDSHHFLGDVGIGEVHNMHRLFTTEESALDYINQCRSGVFVDKDDQQHYNRVISPDYKEWLKELEEIFSDYRY